MSARRRAILCGVLGAAGLAIYLWPALEAPVLVWSDSQIDLEWAREGVGVLSPAPPVPGHPAKPGWIAFLWAATAGSEAESAPRRVILVQAVLVWLSIAGTSVYLGRKTSLARGVVLYAVLILFLRIADAATTVLSEALTAALFLPIAAALLDPPSRTRAAATLGAAIGFLFLVRPNAGAVAGALAVLAFSVHRRGRALAILVVAGILLVLPVWLLTAPPDGDVLRGLSPAFVLTRTEYSWANAAGLSPADASDASRQLVWRLFHGLLGVEHYDASWSAAWWRMDEAFRFLSPILLLAALACLLAPSRGSIPLARVLGLALAGILVAQGYLLGSLTRYALPFLPALFLFAAAAWPPARSVAVAIFVALLAAARWQRHVLDREWGRIEASGVRIVQTIPRKALPAVTPATLRIRIAPALIPSSAWISVLGPDGAVLHDSRSAGGDRRRPYVDIPLPAELLSRNQREPVMLTLVAEGAYGDTQYLLFPVIPSPWGPPARREGGGPLSPTTGVRSGGLDWWTPKPAP